MRVTKVWAEAQAWRRVPRSATGAAARPVHAVGAADRGVHQGRQVRVVALNAGVVAARLPRSPEVVAWSVRPGRRAGPGAVDATPRHPERLSRQFVAQLARARRCRASPRPASGLKTHAECTDATSAVHLETTPRPASGPQRHRGGPVSEGQPGHRAVTRAVAHVRCREGSGPRSARFIREGGARRTGCVGAARTHSSAGPMREPPSQALAAAPRCSTMDKAPSPSSGRGGARGSPRSPPRCSPGPTSSAPPGWCSPTGSGPRSRASRSDCCRTVATGAGVTPAEQRPQRVDQASSACRAGGRRTPGICSQRGDRSGWRFVPGQHPVGHVRAAMTARKKFVRSSTCASKVNCPRCFHTLSRRVDMVERSRRARMSSCGSE